MRCTWIWLTVLAGFGVETMSLFGAESLPAERRTHLLQAAAKEGDKAIPVLRRGLEDPNMVVRRTATRLLGDLGAKAQPALMAALDNEDAVVRQAALKGLLAIDTVDHVSALRRALNDEDVTLRLIAVRELAALHPRNAAENELLAKAAKDPEDAVRSVASRALWPFHRHVIPLRERQDWDHEVEVIAKIPLPKEGWKFRLDPQRNGHQIHWFDPDFDDQAWDGIAIEQAWQKAGYDYIGVAWYRRWVDLPAKPQGKINAVEIAFDGVDECAWVWVNGTYVGEHDIGPAGWNIPFTLDISDAVRWGQRNQITVRAMNTAHAGGIWRPIRIEVLR